MDQPDKERPSDGAPITLTPDMRPVSAAERTPEPLSAPEHARPEGKSRRSAWALSFGILGLVAGLAGLGAAGWLYTEGQAETRRLASEIAQLRVSLDLYARGAGTAPTTEDDSLTDLANRLAILEQNWRSDAQPAPTGAAPAAANATNEDCLPSGMRILVAQGDSYPVCEADVSVNVGQVANGYIGLLDGTIIPSGGTMPLPGSACTIGVTSSGDEGLTGYAEIRVTC